jgi:alpha-amylase/alpha-mannosidase (GH57 family)
MQQVCLALYWHQHQPYYPDDVAGENPMPWVRLHGTKDYWGMAMHLREVPQMQATINLVPSLLAQLLAYTEGGREDAHLRVSRLPADGLAEEDMIYLLDNFFMVHPDHMIRPYPRYLELYQRRGINVDPPLRAAKRFRKQDILDLQVWSNLTWIHPLAFERDAELAAFLAQGRNWTEKEKLWLLEKQMQLLREILPLHKELADRGQVELTTSPFYHPIVPLLYDKRLARRAMPEVFLPKHLDGYPEDAARHIRAAVELHETLLGRKPRGMWPSEGSVCQAMIPAVADAGIEWIATDEQILTCSTDGWVSRDGAGYLRNPQMLYRPWRVEERGRQLQVIFRDHAMSDQIGFHYQRYAAHHAVDDLLGKVEAIGQATAAHGHQRPALVSIILDGENCWEYYPRGGVDFLRQLYQRLAAHPRIRPVRVCDYLERHPASDRLGHLFPGSWISHNFGIWIGHPECNRAWDALHEARQALLSAAQRGDKTPEQLKLAWRELMIAQGSDWFWWFGDDHSSCQDAVFDRLFRKHLQNIYLVLGETPPLELSRPISHNHRPTRSYTEPVGRLNVKIDGRRTYFEWINAGRLVCDRGRGAMTMAADGILSEVHFGFDPGRLLIRLDCRAARAAEQLEQVEVVRVAFFEPSGFELLIANPAAGKPICQLYQADAPVYDSRVEAAVDAIVEVAVPLDSLALATDDAVSFYVELLQGDQVLERVPREAAIETSVPSDEYELLMWQV